MAAPRLARCRSLSSPVLHHVLHVDWLEWQWCAPGWVYPLCGRVSRPPHVWRRLCGGGRRLIGRRSRRDSHAGRRGRDRGRSGSKSCSSSTFPVMVITERTLAIRTLRNTVLYTLRKVLPDFAVYDV